MPVVFQGQRTVGLSNSCSHLIDITFPLGWGGQNIGLTDFLPDYHFIVAGGIWVSQVKWIGCLTSQSTIFQSYMWWHIDVQADRRRSLTHGANLIPLFWETAPLSRILRQLLGIRRTHSWPNPPGPHGGTQNVWHVTPKSSTCVCFKAEPRSVKQRSRDSDPFRPFCHCFDVMISPSFIAFAAKTLEMYYDVMKYATFSRRLWLALCKTCSFHSILRRNLTFSLWKLDWGVWFFYSIY